MAALKKPRCGDPYVFDLYQQNGEWRWRLWAKNGKIVANGGESFKARSWVVKICGKLLPNAPIFVYGERL